LRIRAISCFLNALTLDSEIGEEGGEATAKSPYRSKTEGRQEPGGEFVKGIARFLLIFVLLASGVALPLSDPAWGQGEQVDPPSPSGIETDLTITDITPELIFDDSDADDVDWGIRASDPLPCCVLDITNRTTGGIPVRIEDAAPDWTFYIDDSGDIGLGTNSPAYSLDIQGTSPDLRLYNTIDGRAIFHIYSTGLTEISNTVGDALHGLAFATSGNWWGIYGQSQSPDGEGVVGVNLAGSGIAHGVYGETGSYQGRAVEGWAYSTSGWNYGVYGRSSSRGGRGVYGLAEARTGTTYGVYGRSRSDAGRGVYGLASTTSNTEASYGVFGESTAPKGRGVYGLASVTSGYSVGVQGQTQSPQGWAGRFITTVGRGVYISAAATKEGLSVVSGTKNAVVRTGDGSRLMYSEESTAVWFTDYGFGQLNDGVAVVRINPIFAQTVNLEEPYHVFLEEYGDAELYVSQRTPEWFEVRLGHQRGDRNVAFSYRLVAMRLGFEDQYMERAPWADDDPNLYPETREAWEAQQPQGASFEEVDLAEELPESQSPKVTER
jgi:hypothetical protein